MEFLFRNAYTLVVLVPALMFGLGCGGDPPKPPPGAPTESGEELELDIEVDEGPLLETPSKKQDAGESSDKNPE